jgi:hypothetical protein
MLNIPTLTKTPQAGPSIKTTTGVPNFPVYVSGHSTLAAASRYLISFHLKEPLTKQWQSKPLTRLYGAIHYRMIVNKGLNLGKSDLQSTEHTDGAEKYKIVKLAAMNITASLYSQINVV